jgi:GT2 family glycosyltransferase
VSTEVIIVNWNNRAETLECLAAVERQLSGNDATVTVVDNGSNDGSASAVASRHPHVKLYALPENRGFTGGLAAALAGSTAKHVIFLNNDAVPEEGWLSSMIDSIETAPADVVSIGGRIVDPTGKLIDFIGGIVTFDGHALQDGFKHPVGSRSEPKSGDEIPFACGGNMISRREAFMSLGAFDDDYFAYLEDVDFGWRTWISGGRALFEPRATVRHASSTTSNRLGDFERGVLFERNALQTAIKNYEVLGESMAAVFYTYLHRLHHYATSRNPRADELSRSFGERRRAPSIIRKIRNKLAGGPALATLDDPLTTMQFRALDWVMKHESRIMEKRARVQSRRKRSDQEIFERFPLHVVPTYPGDESMFAGALFRELSSSSLLSASRKLGDIIRT